MLNKIQSINSAPAFTSTVVISRKDAEELNCMKDGKNNIDTFRKKLAKDGKNDVVEIGISSTYNESSSTVLRIYPEKSNEYKQVRIYGMWRESSLDFDKLYKAALTQDDTTQIDGRFPNVMTGTIDSGVKHIWLG